MAKNKNRKQGAQPNRRPQAEQAEERAQRSSMEPMSHPQDSPADVARKKQKSFGHN
ncbi:hypothetical protein [Streptomyces spongiae]|uniref:hypothetical protein n=1 Tax=Streptomyces spongiae TaxID=565072 RepID=UPI00188320F0|nr:hypothetical protein [Streptomyces spongiae]